MIRTLAVFAAITMGAFLSACTSNFPQQLFDDTIKECVTSCSLVPSRDSISRILNISQKGMTARDMADMICTAFQDYKNINSIAGAAAKSKGATLAERLMNQPSVLFPVDLKNGETVIVSSIALGM